MTIFIKYIWNDFCFSFFFYVMGTQCTLIPYFKRSNPKRGIQVTDYHVSWRQPPYSLHALMTGLEKAITEVLDPDLPKTARLCIHLESNTYLQAFCYLYVTVVEWRAKHPDIQDTLQKHFNYEFTEQDTLHLRLQICQ